MVLETQMKMGMIEPEFWHKKIYHRNGEKVY